MTARPKLRLDVVIGGRAPIQIGAFEVYIAPATHPPFTADTQVFEEDTALLTSAPAVIRESTEHPIRLLTDTVFQSLYPVGSVITRTRKCWLAVVYDFEADPICNEEWSLTAWTGVFQHAKRYGIRSLASPLLGISLSSIPLPTLADGFIDAIDSDSTPLRHIWLVTPATQCQQLREILLQHIA